MKMPSRTYLFTVLSVALLSTAAVVLYFWDGSFNLIQSQICPKVSLWETQHITRIFRPIRSLESDNDPENNTFRSLLLPQNGGLLKVRMSNDSEKVNDYGISMFHQLHCLVVLREIIFPGSSTAHAEHDGRMARVHWAHCFDYLAQAIICAADDTLEPPQTVFNEQGQKVQIIDGVGHIDHQCRDPAPLWRAVKEGIVRPYDEAILGNSVRASDLVKDTEYYEIPELYRAE